MQNLIQEGHKVIHMNRGEQTLAQSAHQRIGAEVTTGMLAEEHQTALGTIGF